MTDGIAYLVSVYHRSIFSHTKQRHLMYDNHSFKLGFRRRWANLAETEVQGFGERPAIYFDLRGGLETEEKEN